MRYSELFENKTGKYVALDLDPTTKENLTNFCLTNQIPNPLEPDKFHTTLAHSKEDFPWNVEGELEAPIVVEPESFFWEIFKTQGGANCLVLRFQNDLIDQKNADMTEAGAVSDFPSYKSHVSLSYDAGDTNIDALPLPDFPLVFVKEYQEALEDN